MFESVLGIIAVIGLVAAVVNLYARLGRMEREHKALLSFVLSQQSAQPATTPAVAASTAVSQVSAATEAPTKPAESEISLLDAASGESAANSELPKAASITAEQAAPTSMAEAPPAGPWQTGAASADAETTAAAVSGASEPLRSARPDVETALGTKWAVWVGGVALALGGAFLVRYTIEQGFFGPAARLSLAALFGLVLLAAGEFIRRTGFKVPIEGAIGAFIPAILTAAGAFSLFASIYSAHGVYGFIGPALAFSLLGLVALLTMAMALIHGQALGGLGLLGSLLTPILVSSEAPNPWALFGFLAIVLVSTSAVARLRQWVFLAAGAFAGATIWILLYVGTANPVDFVVVLFISLVVLAALSAIWLGDFLGEPWPMLKTVDASAVATSIFLGFVTLALLNVPDLQIQGSITYGSIILVAMLAAALWRDRAVPLLFGAGLVTLASYVIPALSGTISLEIAGEAVTIDGPPISPAVDQLRGVGWVLAAVFLAAGLWHAHRTVSARRRLATFWMGWGAAVPVGVVICLWLVFGNPDRDLMHGLAALVLALILAAGAEWIARNEEPALTGGAAVSAAALGAGLAAISMLHMLFGQGLTTILVGASAALPAFATRLRAYPVLGWLSVGAVIVVMARIAIDPTIVGPAALGTTPVFNALLAGYGIPALAFAFSAWQLARTTNGRPRVAMEAGAALFALLTAAMLVRHAMHGGVIDVSEPTLAEQAIYTLIALGAGAILIAIDMRSPSSVMRYGSIGAGVLSCALAVLMHFLVLNPLFTDESTGQIPVFNLLLLAYLLPALAAGALALYARDKRPRWYAQMLALLAAVLAFAYATLSLRRLFQGELIGAYRFTTQLETYSYSALWLALGVLILVIGVRYASQMLRIASAALIAFAVVKVFLYDMSELEGALRALSFMGLGAVLIGIGLFYQKLLTAHRPSAESGTTPPA